MQFTGRWTSAGIEYLGARAEPLVTKTGKVITNTKKKAGEWWDAASDAVIDGINSLRPDSLLSTPITATTASFELKSGGSSTIGFARRNGPAISPQPSVWITATVPENGALLAFHFTVRGGVADDCIACAVNGQNIFQLEAKYLEPDSVQSCDPLNISQYSGQTVELFFGLTGGTSMDCELTIDGIRFITIPQPTLVLSHEGDHFSLKWPAAATGWHLQSTSDLQAVPWAALVLPMETSVGQGVVTAPLPWTNARRFFRLRRED